MTPKRKKEILDLLMEKPRQSGAKEIEGPSCWEVYEMLCCHMSADDLRSIGKGKYGEQFIRNVNLHLLERTQLMAAETRSGNGRVSTGIPSEEN